MHVCMHALPRADEGATTGGRACMHAYVHVCMSYLELMQVLEGECDGGDVEAREDLEAVKAGDAHAPEPSIECVPGMHASAQA